MKAQALDDMREGLRRAERRELEALRELDEVKAERDALKAEAGDLRSLSKGREVAHARVREQRDTALRERDEARDCGQEGVCAIAPGCQRHWAERNTELVLERDRWKAMSETYVAGVGANVIRERDEARAALLKATGALMKQYVTAPTSELEALIDECFAAAPKESE